jgi:hypothetical protein
MRTFLLSFAIGGLLACGAIGSDTCKSPEACTAVETCGSADQCGRCGRHCGCEKYCKVVCTTKEVKKTIWAVKCEEFCAPLPGCGHHGCGNCGACEACKAAETTCSNGCDGKCDPCAAEKNKCIVPPKCGKVREKKTLEKKEITCKVPSYKCVVVYACSSCGSQECGEKEAAPIPATPAPAPSKTTLNAPTPPVVGASYVK